MSESAKEEVVVACLDGGPRCSGACLALGVGGQGRVKRREVEKKKGRRENQKERKNPVMDVREGVYKPQLYLLCIACRLWQVKSVEITTYGDFMFLM